jgi:hypothetical protein
MAHPNSGDFLPNRWNCLDFAAEAIAQVDGNGTFQRLK